MRDCASCIDSSKPTEDCVPIRYSNRSKEELFKNYGLLLCIEHKQELVKQKNPPCHELLQYGLWLPIKLRQDLHPGWAGVSCCLLLPELPVVLSDPCRAWFWCQRGQEAFCYWHISPWLLWSVSLVLCPKLPDLAVETQHIERCFIGIPIANKGFSSLAVSIHKERNCSIWAAFYGSRTFQTVQQQICNIKIIQECRNVGAESFFSPYH